jgi:hypothetical protein
MKKLVIAAIALMVSIGAAYAQGQVNFATKVTGVNAKFTDSSGAGALTPPFMAALQLDSGGGNFALVPGTATSFRTGNAAGYVNPITATIPGHDIGSSVVLRVVGFVGGSESDYASALAANNVGFSGPVTVTLGCQRADRVSEDRRPSLKIACSR